MSTTTIPSEPKRVLIIEDDAIVGAVYRGLLTNRGYQVLLETSGKKAVTLFPSFRPDAVLLDIMLPEINGIDVLKQIRALPGGEATPVIVFTNAYVPNMVESARACGANHVLSKSTLTSRQLLEALVACVPGAPPYCGTSLTARDVRGGAATEAEAGSKGPGTALLSPQDSQQAGSSAATEFLNRAAAAAIKGPYSPSLQKPAASEPPPPQQQQPVDEAIRAEFLQSVNPSVTQLRATLSELTKTSVEEQQSVILGRMLKQIRGVGGSAALAGFRPAGDLCSVFEVLLKELSEKPKTLNASIQRTIANTIDILTDLLVKRVEDDLLSYPPPAILVVDDEVLSRRAVTFALERGRLSCTEFSKPADALKAATNQAYDLIFLDVLMPDINGFDLCTQIRALPINQKTPVIFVTSMSDFKSRVRSTLSGGTDLIAKPFVFFELTVKAVTTILQNRAQRTERKSRAA